MLKNKLKETSLKDIVLAIMGMATIFFLASVGDTILPQLISIMLGGVTYGVYRLWPEKERKAAAKHNKRD